MHLLLLVTITVYPVGNMNCDPIIKQTIGPVGGGGGGIGWDTCIQPPFLALWIFLYISIKDSFSDLSASL